MFELTCFLYFATAAINLRTLSKKITLRVDCIGCWFAHLLSLENTYCIFAVIEFFIIFCSPKKKRVKQKKNATSKDSSIHEVQEQWV